MMKRDRRYTTVKRLIDAGHIKAFRDVFHDIPKSIVARDLGMNSIRFSKLIYHVDKFSLKDLFLIAAFLEIEKMVMLDLVVQQYLIDKNKKK